MNERERIYEAALLRIATGGLNATTARNLAGNTLDSVDPFLRPEVRVNAGINAGAPSRAEPETTTPLATQIGGTHYKNLAIQPVEYIHANGIPFCEASSIKYLTRWRDKGGVADLEKAKHFIELLIELENRKS